MVSPQQELTKSLARCYQDPSRRRSTQNFHAAMTQNWFFCCWILLIFIFELPVGLQFSRGAIIQRDDSLHFSRSLHVDGDLLVDQELVHDGVATHLQELEQKTNSMHPNCDGKHLTMQLLASGIQYRASQGQGFFIDGDIYMWRGSPDIMGDGLFSLSLDSLNFTHVSGEDPFLMKPERVYYLVFHPQQSKHIFFVEPKPHSGASGQAVWRFQVDNREWNMMALMQPFKTQRMAISCQTEYCYFHGGHWWNETSRSMLYTNTFLEYNVKQDSWRNLTDESTPYLRLHTSEYFPEKDALLLFGGRNGTIYNTKVFAMWNMTDYQTLGTRATSTHTQWKELETEWSVDSRLYFHANSGMRGLTSVFYRGAAYILNGRFGGTNKKPVVRLELIGSKAKYSALFVKDNYVADYVSQSTAILFGSHVLLFGGRHGEDFEDTLGIVSLC